MDSYQSVKSNWQSIPFEECTLDPIGPWKIQEKLFKFYYRTVTSEMCAHSKNPQHMASAKDEYFLISINHVVCKNIVYIHIATSKNTLMKLLYPSLCMPWEQQYILPWEVAPEVSHSTGVCSLIDIWLLIGTNTSTFNKWKSHKRKSKALSIRLCPSTKGT